MTNKIEQELKHGGEWLGAAREWMQSNIRKGDTICWSSTECVNIPFVDLQEFAMVVAAAAIKQERKRVAKLSA